MNITEEQLERLKNLNDSRVNEILNVLEVGEWYKYNNCILNYRGVKDCGIIQAYGFVGGDWFYVDNFGNNPEQWIKATEQEVGQVLTDEAKKRGFKQGVKFKCLITHEIGEMIEDYLLMNGCFGRDNSLELAFKNDIINGVLFKDGVWAEIIDEKAELKEEIKELRKKLKSLEEKL